MKNITIGVHSTEEYTGGVYNMLSSFGIGLHDAFRAKNLDVKYINEWVKENIMPQFSVGFFTS